MEVLAPVRDLKTLSIAINSGADAVYFAGDAFSARVGAQIERQEAIEMILYCRRRDIKCYLTVNTLIYQTEIPEFLEYLSDMYVAGVDAFIIQNVGLIPIIKEYFAECEVHASTQMHVSNLSAARLVVELGVDRIVMPRELPFDTIKQIKDLVDVPLEVFIHGALCVSYSGQCLISSLVGGRSANKGNCAQICRKNYQWHIDGKAFDGMKPLLNLKDLNASVHIDSYYDAGIDSLKIEGRLKSEEYIMASTQYYASHVNKDMESFINEDELKIVFNRDFTNGRIASSSSHEMMNYDRVNHQGLKVGHVIECQKGYCTINITKPINRLDQLRFVKDDFEDGIQVSQLFQDNHPLERVESGVVRVPVVRKIPKNATVYQLSDMKLKQQLTTIEHALHRRREVSLSLMVKVDVPIEIVLELEGQTHYFVGDVSTQQPLKHSVSIARIIEQLQKTNHTAYNFAIDVKHYEPVFIAMSQLSKMKTEIIDFLDATFTEPRNLNASVSQSSRIDHKIVQSSITYQVRDVAQASALCKVLPSQVYVTDLLEFRHIQAVLAKSGHTAIPVLPNIVDRIHFDTIVKIVENEPEIMVSELGYLNHFRNLKKLHSNYSLYVTNEFDQSLFHTLGVDTMTLPIEACHDQIVPLDTSQSELVVYGYVNAMNLNVCPINQSKITECGNCSLCIDKKYELVNEHNDRFLVRQVGFDQLVVFQSKPIDIIDQIKTYDGVVAKFRVIFEYETPHEVETILDRVNRKHKIYL